MKRIIFITLIVLFALTGYAKDFYYHAVKVLQNGKENEVDKSADYYEIMVKWNGGSSLEYYSYDKEHQRWSDPMQYKHLGSTDEFGNKIFRNIQIDENFYVVYNITISDGGELLIYGSTITLTQFGSHSSFEVLYRPSK